MPAGVLAKQHQPLITVEVSERDVRKEVIAQIGLGLGRERDGSRSGLAQLCNHLTGIGPSPHRTNRFASVEFSVSRTRQPANKRVFLFCAGLLLRLGFAFYRARDLFRNEVLEGTEMLDVFGDRPSLCCFPKAPLHWSQAIHKLQQPRFT